MSKPSKVPASALHIEFGELSVTVDDGKILLMDPARDLQNWNRTTKFALLNSAERHLADLKKFLEALPHTVP